MPKAKVLELQKNKKISPGEINENRPLGIEPDEKISDDKILDPDLILGDEPVVPVVEEIEEVQEDDEETLETYEDDEVNPFGDKWEE